MSLGSDCIEDFIIENRDSCGRVISSTSTSDNAAGCIALVGDGKSAPISSVSVTLRRRLSTLLSDFKGLMASELRSLLANFEDRSGENLDLCAVPLRKGTGVSSFERGVCCISGISAPVLNSMIAPVVSSATMGDLHIENLDLIVFLAGSIVDDLMGLSPLAGGLLSFWAFVKVVFSIENLDFVVACSGRVLYILSGIPTL